MRRISALVVTLMLLLSTSTALADITQEGPPVQLYYQQTVSIDAQLSISSSGTATCSGEIEPRASTSIVSITVALKQKKNGVWTTIASWAGGSYASGAKKVTAGYAYKVVVSGVVKDSGGTVLERPTKETKEKRY